MNEKLKPETKIVLFYYGSSKEEILQANIFTVKKVKQLKRFLKVTLIDYKNNEKEERLVAVSEDTFAPYLPEYSRCYRYNRNNYEYVFYSEDVEKRLKRYEAQRYIIKKVLLIKNNAELIINESRTLDDDTSFSDANLFHDAFEILEKTSIFNKLGL